MKAVNKILFMVLVIVGLGGCIKEDLDGCFSDITLLMSYKGGRNVGDFQREDPECGSVCF